MNLWTTVWVVLMLFWLFFGCWWGYTGAPADRPGRFGSALIPWLCVALLGAMLLGGLSGSGGSGIH